MSVGDYNAFEFSDGYVDVIGTIKGNPAPNTQVVLSSADLVNPDLIPLGDGLGAERYSFLFEGSAQVLDHILVNEPMHRRFTRISYARSNADFPESLRNDGTRPERLSDHDMPVAYFSFPGTPVISLNGPNPLTVECGAVFVDPGASATDPELGPLTIESSGEVNPAQCGSYVVTYTTHNGFIGASATRTVNVVDTTAPALTLLGSAVVTIEAGSIWTDPGATATDACAGDLGAAISSTGTVDASRPGTYTVTYSVSDGFNTATAARTVLVVDRTPPSMTPLFVWPRVLYPPNHKMVPVVVLYAASDLTGRPSCSVAVTSNEPVNGPGDGGHTLVDWQVLSPHLVRLRSERARGGPGRIYTIAVACTDTSGNASSRTAEVRVGK